MRKAGAPHHRSWGSRNPASGSSAGCQRQGVVNPTNTVYSIKRFMGRKYEEVEQERKRVPYQVVRAPTATPASRSLVGGEEKTFTPPEISAMILAR